MYDYVLVRRRRRRKIAALVSLICSIGVTALIIVSFLGQYTGTFTVSLTNSSVRLSLSETQSFTNPTSYLRIDKLNLFEESTYVNVIDEDLDDETKAYDCGQHEIKIKQKDGSYITKQVLSFFKYTFYVGNLGSKAAQYDMKVQLLECNASTDGTNRTLDDTLRVMIYENDIDDNNNSGVHNVDVYAKESVGTNFDINGDVTKREFISTPPNRYATGPQTEDEDHPLAISFEDPKIIHTYSRDRFFASQIRRYTIVSWLEGEDRDSVSSKGNPVGATLKLGVEITAYENE